MNLKEAIEYASRCPDDFFLTYRGNRIKLNYSRVGISVIKLGYTEGEMSKVEFVEFLSEIEKNSFSLNWTESLTIDKERITGLYGEFHSSSIHVCT